MEKTETKTKMKFVKAKITKNNLPNEIFLSKKRITKNIEKFYYKRAKELFNTLNYNEIYICGLGANVNQAIKAAFFITEALSNITIEDISTETINHIDEYINEDNNEVIEKKEDRMSNLIRIKLIKA